MEHRYQEISLQLLNSQNTIRDLKAEIRKYQSNKKNVIDQEKLERNKITMGLKQENRELRNNCDILRQELHEERLDRSRERATREKTLTELESKIIYFENAYNDSIREVSTVIMFVYAKYNKCLIQYDRFL